ncbi:hypothetical protein ACNKHL_22130 [Shigella flexneri]
MRSFLRALLKTHAYVTPRFLFRTPPRCATKGEVHGEHYFFTRLKMNQKHRNGRNEFLEHACVLGNYYGTTVNSGRYPELRC